MINEWGNWRVLILSLLTYCRSFVGSNMPCTAEAVDVLRKANVLVAPSIAAGVGGVGSSALDYSLFMKCVFHLLKNSKHYLNLLRKSFSLCI